ncbi:SGNH/GDSL hydrolase family protein [Flindersiella endophytica]
MSALLAKAARTVRRRMFSQVPVLPEATGDRGRTANGTEPALRLAVLGDSSAAGVGATTHDEALAGRLATMLAGLTGRAISWRVIAETGATTARVAGTLTRDLTIPVEGWRPDVVLVATGVNDLLRWRPLPAFRADVEELFRQIHHRTPDSVVVASGLPPVGSFPLLPGPLRPAAGLRVRQLDRILGEVAPKLGHTHVPLRGSTRERWFAEDGFHLAPAGYQAWARLLALAVADTLDATAAVSSRS